MKIAALRYTTLAMTLSQSHCEEEGRSNLILLQPLLMTGTTIKIQLIRKI